jgi:hypothetical protein
MGERSGESCRLSAQTTEAGVEMPVPRHDDHEDQFLLKPAGLRDTHSEGKVIRTVLSSEFIAATPQALSFMAAPVEPCSR